MGNNCIACGMPMKTADDYAMGDSSKTYCKYCCNEDGTMQSYNQKLLSMTQFIIKTKNLDKDTAGLAAKDIMSKLPAWTDK